MRSEPEVRGYDERAGATRSLDADRGGWGDDTAGRADATAAEVPTDADVDVRQGLVQETATFTRQFNRWVDDQVWGDGLTMPSLRVLERLHCQGPATMRTLADELDLSPRNVTALVDALEADDLVVRKPHPTDRRATIVELTPGGFEAADALIAPRIVAMGSLFDVLDDGECAVFTRVLHRLRDAMADGSAPCSPAHEVEGRAGAPAPQV